MQFSSLASYTVLSSRFYIHNTRPFHIKSFLLKSGFWNEFIDLVETKQDIKQYMYDYPNSKISQKKTLIHFQPRHICTILWFFFSLDEVAHIRSVLTKAELEVNNIPKCLEVYNNILIYLFKNIMRDNKHNLQLIRSSKPWRCWPMPMM